MIAPLPPRGSDVLTKNTSPMHYLRTKNKVIVPRFNIFHEINSIALRAFTVWDLLTPDLTKTFNVKNHTRMPPKSDNLRNLDFRAESSQTMPHNDNDHFLYYEYEFNILLLLKFLIAYMHDLISGNALITIVLK